MTTAGEFTLYPAVDMKAGRCVRLMQGRAEDVTDYGDPVQAALRWQNEGTAWLHMVDLDGAFSGKGANLDAVASVVRETSCRVQLGGGVRSEADAAHRLETLGVARVVIGTLALRDEAAALRIAARFPGRVALGLDARDGMVAVEGWTENSGVPADEFAARMVAGGFAHVIFTDIARDSMMTGVNRRATEALVQRIGRNKVIASGGVSSLEDIRAVRAMGCSGAIVGKALYEGVFTLGQALAAAQDD